MTKKEAEEILKELEYLKKENSKLKSLLRSYEKKSKNKDAILKEEKNFKQLNDFSFKLAQIPLNKLFPFLVSEIKSIFGVKAVVLNTYDNQNSELVVKYSSFSSKDILKLGKILGGKFIDRRIYVNKQKYKKIVNEFYSIELSFNDLAFGAIDEDKDKSLEKILKLDCFAQLALIHKKELKGTLVLGGSKNQMFPNKDLVSAYAAIIAYTLVRKEAEEKLLETEIRYRNIVNSSPMGMHIYELQENDKLVFIGANPAADKILGFGHKSLYGLTIEKAFPSLVNTEVPLKYREVIKKNTIWKTEQINYKDEKIVGAFEVFAFKVSENQVVVRFLEITERINKENILKENEEKLSITLNSIGDGVISTDKMGLITQMNPVAEKLCGWKFEQALGKQLDEVFNIIDATTKKKLSNPVEKVIKTGKVVELANHTVLISKDGIERNISDSAAPILDKENNIQGVVLVFSDVTEAYKARSAIKKSEERLRTTAKIAKVGGWEIDLLGRIQYWTEETFKIHELDGNDTPSLDDARKFYHPDDQEMVSRKIEHSINTSSDFDFEARLITAKKNHIWVRVIGNPIYNEQGSLIGLSGMIQDITQRKRYEIAIKDEKERISTILNLIGDPIFVKDDNHRFTLANKAFYQMVGLDEQNVIGKTLAEDIPQAEMEHFLRIDRHVLETGIPDIREEELTINNKTRTIITSKTRFTDDSGRKFLIGSIHDLTDRVNAEKEKAHTYELMKYVIENTKSSVSVHDTEMNYIFVSKRYYEDFNLSENEIIGRNHYEVFPDLPQFLKDIHKRALNGETLSGQNDMLIHRDGSVDWANWTCMPWFNADRTIGGIIIYIEVITERKRAIEALTESEHKFRALAENVPGVIYLCKNDERWSMIYLNDAVKNLTGYSKEEFLSNQISFADLYHPDDKEHVYKEVEIALNENLPFQIEYRIFDKNKNCKWIEERGVKLIGENKSEVIEGFLSDITERKLAEEKIRDREAMISALVESSQDWIWAMDEKGIHTYSNPACKEIIGYETGDIVGSSFELMHPDDIEMVKNNLPIWVSQKKGWKNLLIRFLHKNGTWRYLESSSVPIIDSSGEFKGFRGVDRDITERKNAEEQIELLAQMVNVAPGAIIIHDFNGRIFYANQRAAQMHGYTKEEFNKLTLQDLNTIESRNRISDRLNQLSISGELSFEGEHLRKDGTTYPVQVYAKNIDWAGQQAILSISTDITERKFAEETLRKSEERFSQAIAGTGAGLWDWDIVNDKVYFSPQWKNMLGYENHEVANDFSGWKNLWHPDDSAMIEKAIEDYLQMKTSVYEVVHRLKHKDGSWRWILTRGDIHRDSSGIPIRWIGTNIDITESKKAEEELDRTKIQLKESIMQSPLPMVLVSAENFKIKVINKATEDFLQINSHEYLDKSLFDIEVIWQEYTPDGEIIDASELPLPRALQGLVTYSKEMKLVRKDGSTVWQLASGAPIFDSQGKLIAGLLIMQDITDRKLSERTLIESEELYRKLLTTVPDLIVHTDLKGDITFINEFAFPTLNYFPNQTFLGKNMLSFISEEDLPRAIENTKLMFEHKLGIREYKLKFEDGTFMDAEVNGDVIYDAERNPAGMVYVIRNITERKKMEIEKQKMIEDLVIAKEKAEEMNKVKSHFFANMSHELRTPFVGIMGYAELLSESVENPSDKSMVDGILKASSRMQNTLSKILNLAKLESASIEVQKNKVNVGDLITNIYESFKGGALHKEISFEKKVNFDELIIESDEILIKEILQNFVNNAIKFTNSGGVELSADVINKNKTDILVIKVADSGVGIPSEKLDLIWEPFRQASEGMNRSFEGTGLGLSIVKRSADLLGGTVSVKSECNKGSVFVLELPII